MVCKKCGKKLKIGEEFCSVCGYYNGSNDDEQGFLDDEDTKSYNDDDFFDEVEEVDEEDYDKDNGGKVVEENLINRLNVEDNNDINAFSTKSNAKSSKKEMTNFKEDRLIEAFIGEDYKWIIRRPLNIYALLLSWVYFIYRKMYITGVLGLILTGVVCRLLPSFIK